MNLKNRGAVLLISVLSLVALMVTLLTRTLFTLEVEEGLSMSYQLDRLSDNAFQNVTQWAIYLLEQDSREEAENLERNKIQPFDGVMDKWNQGHKHPWIEMDLVVRWRLVPLNSKFNINSLVDSTGIVKTSDRNRLINFLNELRYKDPEALAAALIDWIDRKPQETGESLDDPNEFEVDSRNAPLILLEEIAMVPGFTRKIIWAEGEDDDKEEDMPLLPYITINSAEKINPNFAEPWVVLAVHPEMTRSAARSLVDGRATSPYETLEAVDSRFSLGTDGIKAQDFFSLNSNEFALEMEAEYLGHRLKRRVILSRTDGKVSVGSVEPRGYFYWNDALRSEMDEAIKEERERLRDEAGSF